MTDQTMTLFLEANPPDALTQDEVDDLTRALRGQLDVPELTAGVTLAGSASAPVGAGAKGLGQDLGALVLHVLPETVPALVDSLKGFITRESRVKLKVQVGANLVELDFDARTMDEARVEALAGRLQRQLSGDAAVGAEPRS